MVKLKNNDNKELISKIEKTVYKTYKKKLIRDIKNKNTDISEIWIKTYIPFKDYVKLHPETKKGYVSYILKQSNNDDIPQAFFSKPLTDLINHYEYKRQ